MKPISARHRTFFAWAVFPAAVALAAAFAVPGVAVAAPTLTDGSAVTVLSATANNPCAPQCIPFTGQNMDFSFTTTAPYWSVVGLRPSNDDDYNLGLHDASGTAHDSSIFGTNVLDFIAIDSNRRATGGYTATATRVGGDLSAYLQYQVELGQPNLILWPQPAGAPSEYVNFTPDGTPGLITVRDVPINSGQTATITINSFQQCPAAPDPNVHGEALLMSSDPADPTTWLRARRYASAITAYPTPDNGCSATLRFTASRTAWYGLVMLDYGLTGMAVHFQVS